jgi:hypothetical protein
MQWGKVGESNGMKLIKPLESHAFNNSDSRLGMVVHGCNPSYSGRGGRWIVF